MADLKGVEHTMQTYTLVFPVLNGIFIYAEDSLQAIEKARKYIKDNNNIRGGMLYDMHGKLIYTN